MNWWTFLQTQDQVKLPSLTDVQKSPASPLPPSPMRRLLASLWAPLPEAALSPESWVPCFQLCPDASAALLLPGRLFVSINPCCSALETTRRCKRSPQSQFHCHNPANKWADASHWMGWGVARRQWVSPGSLYLAAPISNLSPSFPFSLSRSLPNLCFSCSGPACFPKPCPLYQSYWCLTSLGQYNSVWLTGNTMSSRRAAVPLSREQQLLAQRLGQGWFLNVQVTESAYRMSETMLAPFTELHLWNILHRIHVCLAHTVPGRMNRQHGSLGSSA